MTTRKKKTTVFDVATKVSTILSTLDGTEEKLQSLVIAAVLGRSYDVADQIIRRLAERQALADDEDYIDELDSQE